MSLPVDLDHLADAVGLRTAQPFLVTLGTEGPKVVCTTVAVADGRLTATAGRGTRANVAANPAVTLLWPDETDLHALLVDGSAEADGEAVVVTPASAILHVRR